MSRSVKTSAACFATASFSGGRVPDESTLKRRLRDIWVTLGLEASRDAVHGMAAHRGREKETAARP